MTFDVIFTFKGKSHTSHLQSTSTSKATTTGVTGRDLYDEARKAYGLDEATTEVKLLLKGKRIEDSSHTFPLLDASKTSTSASTSASSTKKIPKIIVMATPKTTIDEISTKRSDPTIRGFDQEKITSYNSLKLKQQQRGLVLEDHWAEGMTQHKDYKFCRFDPCHDQSFGHRSNDNTPHAFAARQLLEKMATDPGVVAIMKERELVVGTLGEMDPIDDRIMLAKQAGNDNSCLLGYNTNGGSRIDIKLRTDDLTGFRPYPELVSTLIHELSHNWIGEHDLLFWTNYAQMRAEYFFTHARLLRTSLLVNGKPTSELAGLDRKRLDNVYECIMTELVREMAQHRLHPNMIEAPIRERIQQLEEEDAQNNYQGRMLGTSSNVNNTKGDCPNDDGTTPRPRERALAAAERRAREQQQQQQQQQGGREGEEGGRNSNNMSTDSRPKS